MSTKNTTNVPAGGHSTAAASADTTTSTTPTYPTKLLRARLPPAAAVAALLQSNFQPSNFSHETYGRGTSASKVSSGGIAESRLVASFAVVFSLSVHVEQAICHCQAFPAS